MEKEDITVGGYQVGLLLKACRMVKCFQSLYSQTCSHCFSQPSISGWPASIGEFLFGHLSMDAHPICSDYHGKRSPSLQTRSWLGYWSQICYPDILFSLHYIFTLFLWWYCSEAGIYSDIGYEFRIFGHEAGLIQGQYLGWNYSAGDEGQWQKICLINLNILCYGFLVKELNFLHSFYTRDFMEAFSWMLNLICDSRISAPDKGGEGMLYVPSPAQSWISSSHMLRYFPKGLKFILRVTVTSWPGKLGR